MPKPYLPNSVVTSNLSALMKARGVNSQPALSARSGVQQTTVGRVLRGAASPMADTLKALADALDCDMGLLYLPEEQFLQLLQSGRSMRFDVGSLSAGARPGVLRIEASAGLVDDVLSWRELPPENVTEVHVDFGVPAYGVRIRGDGGNPVLKAGQVLVLQDGGQAQPGDQAVFHFKNGVLLLKELLYEQPEVYATASLIGSARSTLEKADIAKISLVVGLLPASRVAARKELS